VFDKKLLAASLLACAFLAAAFLAPPVALASTITVVNLDGPGEGFNDPTPVSPVGGNTGTTLGAQRLIAFQFAAGIWATLLDSPVEIRVGAEFNPLPCDATSAVLGGAAPNSVHKNFAGAPVTSTWYPQALANSLAGVDLWPSVDDIGAEFNSAIGTTCALPTVFYYGLDASPPSNYIDFVTVVLHELGHGLGFLTFVDLETGAKLTGLNDTYMLNLEDHSTGELYPDMTDAERVTASTDTGDLHWVGPNVVGASGDLTDGAHPSGHVEMYAPNPQEAGSSVSHFSTALSPDELMEPIYTAANHDVGLAAELFVDMGWRLIPTVSISTNQSTYRAGDRMTVTVTTKPNGSTASWCLVTVLVTPTTTTPDNPFLIYTFDPEQHFMTLTEAVSQTSVDQICARPVGPVTSESFTILDITLPPSITVPGGFSPGTYVWGTTFFAPDLSKNGNVAVAVFTYEILPDLVVSTLTNPPASVAQGGSFSVTDTTLNQETGPAGASTTRYRLSTDSNITSSDSLLTGTRSVPSLAAGASSTGTITVTVPTTVATGTYYLGACADDLAAVAESNEANNCRASTTTVQVTAGDGKDLVIEGLAVSPSSVAPGGSVTVTYNVANWGTTTVTETYTEKIYLSTDQALDTTLDTLLCTSHGHTTDLAANATHYNPCTVTIPSSTTSGSYYILVQADALAAVSESNEGNNVASVALTVTSGLPDLVVTSLTAPTTATIGGTISISVSVLNQGSASAGPFYLGFYFSTDSTITASDTYSGWSCYFSSGVVTGATSTCSGSIGVPSSLAPGTYYLGAIADFLGQVAESNENNNARSADTGPIVLSL
jgi:hypothetical protein